MPTKGGKKTVTTSKPASSKPGTKKYTGPVAEKKDTTASTQKPTTDGKGTTTTATATQHHTATKTASHTTSQPSLPATTAAGAATEGTNKTSLPTTSLPTKPPSLPTTVTTKNTQRTSFPTSSHHPTTATGAGTPKRPAKTGVPPSGPRSAKRQEMRGSTSDAPQEGHQGTTKDEAEGATDESGVIFQVVAKRGVLEDNKCFILTFLFFDTLYASSELLLFLYAFYFPAEDVCKDDRETTPRPLKNWPNGNTTPSFRTFQCVIVAVFKYIHVTLYLLLLGAHLSCYVGLARGAAYLVLAALATDAVVRIYSMIVFGLSVNSTDVPLELQILPAFYLVVYLTLTLSFVFILYSDFARAKRGQAQ